MKKEQFIFCPLGGSGEIGMNMNLYAYGKEDNQKWIVVDMGVTFADDSIPGIDLIFPDPGFILDKKDDLLGIVLTHAHEDHIGAVAHIWPSLKCKMYANYGSLNFKKPKTKLAQDYFKKTGQKSALLIASELDQNTMLAIRNLKDFNFLDAKDINPYDLLKAKHILLTHSAVPVIKEALNVK